jgi:hypothetical protein
VRMTCPYSDFDGAYVLGSLAAAARAEYERHLTGCDDCSRSVRELAGMPGLLARVPADVLEQSADHEAVPATLLPALVAAAERQQRRRTIRTSLIAAAAVAVIATGAAVVTASIGDDETPVSSPPPAVETTAVPQLMTPVGDGRSTGWVSLTPVPGGTRVDLTCVYNGSFGSSHAYSYKVVVYPTEGLAQPVQEFTARSGEEVEVSGRTAIELDEIEKVVVKNSYGPILLLTPART